MNAFDWLSSGARLTSWFHQLSAGKSARPPKSSLRATPVDGADGVDGVSVGAVGTDGDSFAPPQAATRMLHTTSAVMSTFPPPPLRGFGVASALSHPFAPRTFAAPCTPEGYRLRDQARISISVPIVSSAGTDHGRVGSHFVAGFHDLHEIARQVAFGAISRNAASGAVQTVEPGIDASHAFVDGLQHGYTSTPPIGIAG